MPYLNVDLNYFDHPKTLQLIAILGNGAAELPLRLWAYAGKFHAKSGALGRRTVAEVESIMRWWGEPGLAVRGLQRTGFLARTRDGFVIHAWKEHQGHIQALKERNKKAAVNRWRNLRGKKEKQASAEGTIEVPLVQDGMPLAVPFRSVPLTDQQQVDREKKDLTALIASVGFIPGELEAHVFPIPGEDHGRKVIDMEPSRCQWWLDRVQMDPKTTAALKHRVKIKTAEVSR